ncbi:MULTISPECIES: ester cyclase [unclassified Gluconobacter]|nr:MULTISPECIES: ester cyclase [unclassified Gluconobacter]
MQSDILIEENKQVVLDFNMQVIVAGNRGAFDALMRRDFVNRSAPPGVPDGRESLWNTFENILRPALGNLTVEIHDQIAEGDKVTTRKTINGVHIGPFMGVPATGKPVTINVIDIVRVEQGQYVEHWGINDLTSVLARLSNPA